MNKTKLYISKSRDPFENLALEEWALQNLNTSNQDYLILYVNSPCVVIGRNQNIFQEINLAYCRKHKVQVSRRISGGGTVFHDEGNLNWTHISSFDTKKVNNYAWAAEPIIDLLASYQLKAYLTDRNAIEIDGLKVSGQAQFTNRKNILSHGTLLVNSNLAFLQGAIEPNPNITIQSKATPSVRSQTVNISKLLEQELQVKDVMERFKAMPNFELQEELNVQTDLVKFKTNQWIFERSPKFTAVHEIEGKKLVVAVEKAKIRAIKSEKGHLLQDNPFLNQTYEKFLNNYS